MGRSEHNATSYKPSKGIRVTPLGIREFEETQQEARARERKRVHEGDEEEKEPKSKREKKIDRKKLGGGFRQI